MLITDVWEWMPFLKRHARTIALFTVLTAAVTMVVSFVMPPTYKSTATLAVQPLTQDQPLAYPSAVELGARNVGELIKSPSVEKRAARSLRLAELTGEPEYRVNEGGGLIQATVLAGSPAQAAREANAIAEAFIQLNSESLRAGADRAQGGLDDQLARLRGRIATTQDELTAARQKANSAAAVSELQDQLDALNTAYEGVLRGAQVLPASETMLSTAVMLADRAVAEPKPVSPQPLLNLLLSVVGGLLLGIAYARGTELTTRRSEAGR